MRLRPIVFGAVGVSVLLAFAAGSVRAATPPQATVAAASALRPLASSAVHRALERRGSVPVIVTLHARDLPSARRLAARRDRVAALQGGVLARLRSTGFDLSRRWSATPGFAGTVSRRGLERLLASPEVARVDVDRRVKASLSESGTLIRADQAHAVGVTGKGAIVAVVDTGIDTDHPDLANDIAAEACFLHKPDRTGACPNGANRQTGPGAAEDDEGHGTSVSGIITSSGTASPRGVAPDAKIVAVKVLGPDGGGPRSDIIAGLDWILTWRRDVKVVNMSLGSEALFQGPCDDVDAGTIAYASVVKALRARGVTVFAAAGNSGSATSMGAPACVGSALSVGAVYDANLGAQSFGSTCEDSTTGPDKVICFSDGDATLDLLAPGGAIMAAKRGGGAEEVFGTSAATPHAAAVAALVLEAKPGLSPDQLEATLEQTGVPVTDGRNGGTFPRVDAAAAVQAAPTLPDVAPPAYVPAGSSAFVDGTGETLIGPELRDISAASNGNGLLTFTIGIANRPASLNPGEFVEVYVDADKNAATGEEGADYFVSAPFGGGAALLFRWVGAWQPVRLLENVGFSAGVVTLVVSADEFGVRSDFRFWALSRWTRGVFDRAPNAGAWSYPAFPLTVAKTGTGAGTVTGPAISCGTVCSGFYGRDETVSLSVAAATGSAFVEWSGACTGAAGCTTTLGEARQVTARFELLRVITVKKGGTGAGTVAWGSIACGTTCAATAPHGSVLTVTAQAEPGSRFRRWGGSCSGTGPCQLAVNADKTMTAEFADVAKPAVSVLRSRGRAGRLVPLRYRVRDNGGGVRVEVVVRVRGRKVVTFRAPPAVATGGLAAALWKAPRKPAGRVSFCVRATDLAGNRSPRRCRPVRLS